MNNKPKTIAVIYGLCTAALFAVAIAMLFVYAPVEATMGPIQKLFYVHLPSAISTFLACLLCFIASIGYLTQRKGIWDDLAAAGAGVSVIFCTIVLATGMTWGKFAWGHWWTWSPRLTFSLVLWLLYVVYLMIRASIESSERRALVAAVYGILAFLDVPLVYLSTKLMVDIHPTSVELAPEMKLTLAVWFAPVLLLAAGLVVLKFRANTRHRLARAAQLDSPQNETPGLGLIGG